MEGGGGGKGAETRRRDVKKKKKNRRWLTPDYWGILEPSAIQQRKKYKTISTFFLYYGTLECFSAKKCQTIVSNLDLLWAYIYLDVL